MKNKKISAEDLFKILIDHKLWLENNDRGKQANLEGTDLQGTDLQETDLRGANLEGANLKRANLKRANLEGANLKMVFNIPFWIEMGLDHNGVFTVDKLVEGIRRGFNNLEGASLNGADLRETDLRGTNLQETDLRGAKLEGANLEEVCLREANLKGANLENVDLQRADLTRADLGGTNLDKTNLRKTNIDEANFEGAVNIPEWIEQGLDNEGFFAVDSLVLSIRRGFDNLEGARLIGADLEGADLKGVNLQEADLRETNLHRTNLEGASLVKADLQGADLRKANLRKANLTHAILYESDLNEASLRETDLRETNLRKAHLKQSIFENSDLFGTNFGSSYLEKTIFKEVVLRNTKGWETANFVDTEMSNYAFKSLPKVVQDREHKNIVIIGENNPNEIKKEIRFTEEYYQSGIQILNNFIEILHDKFESEDGIEAGIRMLNNNVVQLVITPRNSEQKVVAEDTLKKFGEIVASGEDPSKMLRNYTDREFSKIRMDIALSQAEHKLKDRQIEQQDEQIKKQDKQLERANKQLERADQQLEVKDQQISDLGGLIKFVLEKNTSLSEELTRKESQVNRLQISSRAQFTENQLKYLILIQEGLSQREIAYEMTKFKVPGVDGESPDPMKVKSVDWAITQIEKGLCDGEYKETINLLEIAKDNLLMKAFMKLVCVSAPLSKNTIEKYQNHFNLDLSSEAIKDHKIKFDLK